MSDYDCPKCGETHTTVTDADGYELANCQRGTILVASPGEDR